MAATIRDRVPAFVLVALLHGAAVYALVHAIIVERAPEKPAPRPYETLITLTRETPPPRPKRKRRLPPGGGSNAAAAPFFDPYTYQSPPALAEATRGILTALSACDPAHLDMAAAEVRDICSRIGLALKNDPGHFGVVADIRDPQHWRRELARREAPFLAPCMSPKGLDVLHTLSCIYKVVFGGYDSETRPRYSQ
jgi:hypothetical protein